MEMLDAWYYAELWLKQCMLIFFTDKQKHMLFILNFILEQNHNRYFSVLWMGSEGHKILFSCLFIGFQNTTHGENWM